MLTSNKTVKITAGKWRGRKINFDAKDNIIRPTACRLRETLFNWLQYEISSSYCLDLFAGSGILSFEALSRGAYLCTLVEKNPTFCKQIQQQKTAIGANSLSINQQDVFSFLKQPSQYLYNTVFIDPPFTCSEQYSWLKTCCEYLVKYNFLSKDAFVYLESGAKLDLVNFPLQLKLIKNKKVARVHAYLLQNTT